MTDSVLTFLQEVAKGVNRAVDQATSDFMAKSLLKSFETRPEWTVADHFAQMLAEAYTLRLALLNPSKSPDRWETFNFYRDNPEKTLKMVRENPDFEKNLGTGPLSLTWRQFQASHQAPTKQAVDATRK